MDEHLLEVFQQTQEHSLLRLNGPNQTRTLDRRVIKKLIDEVEKVYSRGSNAPLTFGSQALHDLGRRMYELLDGDERWMSGITSKHGGAALRIDAEERLRHLPWELVVGDGAYLVVDPNRPFLPIRAVVNQATLTNATPANRPLRVLFMATAPEGGGPALEFEREEAMILERTTATGTELVVEESGTLEGLRFQADSYGAGYFDVLHLTGHANVTNAQPVFLVEDELGRRQDATPQQIADAIGGQWPRLVFLSGCLTGNAPGQGELPSMCESLVKAGAPAVLGWALPVGDQAASQLAGFLYEGLSAGHAVSAAVAHARRRLHGEKSPFWHYLRLYADRSPLTAMVTALNAPGRARLKLRAAATVFLDTRGQVRVASRAEFVGRRRVIQRCLRILKAPLAAADSHEGVVLGGMGGLERMPMHQRVVWYGRVDEGALRQQLTNVAYPSLAVSEEATKILNADAPISARLRYLLLGPLAQTPCLFVFDDFEQGNLEERADGARVCSKEMSAILAGLLLAIREANSASRVLVTSRYQFPCPHGGNLGFVALETFNGNELAKKLRSLKHLRPAAATDSKLRARAIAAAANNPRLLEWLDTVVGDKGLDSEQLIAAIENKAAEFREQILARELIKSQDPGVEKLLARVNVVELPIPEAAVRAMCPLDSLDAHIRRAIELGLLEVGLDPETDERRYFVSNVLRPLLPLSEQEYKETCAAAARSLKELWLGAAPKAAAVGPGSAAG
jgi:hypothetical protein